MAVKKATPKSSSKKTGKGDKYSCSVCGLVVSIDEPCGEDAPCDLICCGEQMKPKKAAIAK